MAIRSVAHVAWTAPVQGPEEEASLAHTATAGSRSLAAAGGKFRQRSAARIFRARGASADGQRSRVREVPATRTHVRAPGGAAARDERVARVRPHRDGVSPHQFGQQTASFMPDGTQPAGVVAPE